ncbi:MAG: hypothetical protein ACI9VR_000965 [Cognaticolwellia sp.]|jgi:hypothetical protein
MRLPALVALFSLSGCALLEGNDVCPQEDPALHIGQTPTSLDEDCRCLATFGASTNYPLECQDSGSALANGAEFGEGPKLWEMGARIRGGDLWEDRGEIITAVSNGSNQTGFVLALDIETGDRRIVSGAYLDSATGITEVGSGGFWLEPSYALRGPDDMLYVYANGTRYDDAISGQDVINEIWRVDPDSGDRELVWQHKLKNPDPSSPYGICENGVLDNQRPLQLMLEGGAFEVAEDGAFFIGNIRNGSPMPGVGFIEISADGSSCRVVSMNQGLAGNEYENGVGGGMDFGLAVETINHVNGELLVMDNNNLLRVDRETGDRERLMTVGWPGVLQWDESRSLYHLTNIEPPYVAGGVLATVDVDAEQAWMWSRCSNIDEDHPFAEACVEGGNASNILNNNQGWVLPDGEHIITVNNRDSFAIVDMDTAVLNHFSL